jgi:hypothetical protein
MGSSFLTQDKAFVASFSTLQHVQARYLGNIGWSLGSSLAAPWQLALDPRGSGFVLTSDIALQCIRGS